MTIEKAKKNLEESIYSCLKNVARQRKRPVQEVLKYYANLENNYLNETNFPIVKNNYVVISGCCGGGKSTLLSELMNRGYSVVLEPGRQIVKEQTAVEGDTLPWINLQKFLIKSD